MTSRRIAVVTGTRAEYGLLKGLLRLLAEIPEIKLHLIVTGAHLERKFDETWREVESDGFSIDSRVPLHIDGDGPVEVAAAAGRALVGIAQALSTAAPDLLVIVGDRYEILAAAEAATLCRIPIAHVHGGERTEGAMDEAFRHAVTKMSHLHFAACEEYRRRIIQLGEDPSRVFNVGSLGVDAIAKIEAAGLDEVERSIGASLGAGYLLVTYHPTTLDPDGGLVECCAMLCALGRFPNFSIIVTGVNADPGYAQTARLLKEFAASDPGRIHLVNSMGQRLYLSAMKYCRAVIGNSSSGIIEAPSLNVATVNVGNRQKGRARAASVIDCGSTEGDIAAAISRAISPEFQAAFLTSQSPYGGAGATNRMADIIREFPLTGILNKSFYDISIDKAFSA